MVSPLLGRFLVSFNLQSAICGLQSAVFSLQSAVCSLQSAVCSLRSAVCKCHTLKANWHSTAWECKCSRNLQQHSEGLATNSSRTQLGLCKFWWLQCYTWPKQRGVISQNKEVIPTVLGIQCVVPKLELAGVVCDASKSCPALMAKFEDTLRRMFNYYYFFPKRWRE